MATAIAFPPEIVPARQRGLDHAVGRRRERRSRSSRTRSRSRAGCRSCRPRGSSTRDRRRSREPGRVHAQARARLARLHARVHLRPRQPTRCRGRRRGRSNVVLSGEARFVPLSTRACLMLYRLVHRAPDRRRPDRERARRPPGVARRRRVPRAPAPALLTHSCQLRDGTHAESLAAYRLRSMTSCRVSMRSPEGSSGPASAAAARPSHDSRATHARAAFAARHRSARARPRSTTPPISCASSRRSSTAASPSLTMHFQPIVHASDARAVRLRGAAALDRQVAAASRRDPRRRRAARADPDARSRGARADGEGDRERAARARPRVRQPPPARPVRQAADLAVRAAVEGRDRASSSRSPSAPRSRARSIVRYRVAELRELGFQIAIDDLGGGHARMGTFTPLDTDFVKLDMSLVRDVDKHPMKQRLIRSVTELCREQGHEGDRRGRRDRGRGRGARRSRLRSVCRAT